MSLKETLKQDYTKYYKVGDKQAVAVLRGIRGAITTAEKSGKEAEDFTDAQVETLISREAKRCRASADEYRAVGAAERADAELWEAEFLAQYLPQQLSEDEVRVEVHRILLQNAHSLSEDGSLNSSHMGKAMKLVMVELKGKADGKLVKRFVQEELSQ